MLGEADESHIVRCVDYWLAERRLAESRKSPKKEWLVVAVLAAENVRESHYLPVIELLSQKIPLTVIEITGLKVRGYTTLNFAKIFDGQDQLEQTESGDEDIASGKDVDRRYWADKRPEGIMRIADSLAKIFQSADRQLRVTYLQGFWGFALGEKARNFVTITPKQKFVNVRARIRDTERWSARLKKTGFEITGGHAEEERAISCHRRHIAENRASSCANSSKRRMQSVQWACETERSGSKTFLARCDI
jgi:hypothetical protein